MASACSGFSGRVNNVYNFTQSIDFRPPEAAYRLHERRSDELQTYRRQYEQLMSTVLQRTNGLLQANGLPIVFVPEDLCLGCPRLVSD